jgi:hypothetical protein
LLKYQTRKGNFFSHANPSLRFIRTCDHSPSPHFKNQKFMQPIKILFGAFFLLLMEGNAQTIPGRFIADSTPVIKIKKEPRFTLNVHGGYGVGLGSTFRFYPDDITSVAVVAVENNPTTTTTNSRSPSKGLGDGFRIGVGLSYTLNDFVNIGVDVDYFNSRISKIRDSSYREIKLNDPIDRTYTERYEIAYDASLLTISPNITFKAISRPNWFVYNKLGAVLTVRPNSIQRETVNMKTSMNWQGFIRDSTSTVQRKYDWGIRNPAFGFMGGIGVQVKVYKKIRAFTEIQFSHIVFQVRTRSLTELFIDGKDMINTIPVFQREIEFKKTIASSDVNQSPNMPSKAVVQRFPVTYVGVQSGIAYRF